MTQLPRFDMPGGETVKVSVIDSTMRLSGLPVSSLLEPPIEGFDTLSPITTWSFLVESSTGKKALFDLGAPKDPFNHYAPSVVEMLTESGCGIHVQANVADILEENGVQPAEINSIIWSHHHFDHIGDVSTFPASTELIVGPGFKDAFCPGYPANPTSPVREVDFRGRSLREINFGSDLVLGPFKAFDFFGDGSFYLLDTPGHAIGHLSGLARTTTSPNTFILMGGDLCHHGGELRPSPYFPLLPSLSDHLSLSDSLRLRLSSCPGSKVFNDINAKRGRTVSEPLFDPVLVFNKEQAMKTIKEAQRAEAQDNIFCLFAHDMSILGVVDTFPETANDWKAKGWKEKAFWKFLNDLEVAVAENVNDSAGL
ncbi:hypothetical protein V2G26_004370 [Clonostachys chloroleuca]